MSLKKRSIPTLSSKDSKSSSSNSKVSKIIGIKGGATNDDQPIFSLTLGNYKMLLQLLLTLFNVICWSFPLNNRQLKENTHILSIANCFAGGIFLMLAFNHLIPQAIEGLATHGPSVGGDKGFRALLFVVVGFLAMLFVEKIAFTHPSSDTSIASPSDSPTFLASQSKMPTLPKSMAYLWDESDQQQQQQQQSSSSPLVDSIHPVHPPPFRINSAMILCFAMSIHSFFESMALGLANSYSSASLMSACISLHQPAESLALVVAFMKQSETMTMQSMILWLSGFSCVAMCGNLVGRMINHSASEAMEAIIVAMTAGTFIYVGASEIVNEEFESDSFVERCGKFLSYLLGMVAMLVITTIVNKWEAKL